MLVYFFHSTQCFVLQKKFLFQLDIIQSGVHSSSMKSTKQAITSHHSLGLIFIRMRWYAHEYNFSRIMSATFIIRMDEIKLNNLFKIIVVWFFTDTFRKTLSALMVSNTLLTLLMSLNKTFSYTERQYDWVYVLLYTLWLITIAVAQISNPHLRFVSHSRYRFYIIFHGVCRSLWCYVEYKVQQFFLTHAK